MPVFLQICETIRCGGVAVLRWEIFGEAPVAAFRVEARCDGESRLLRVLDEGAGRFSATAPADLVGEITFELYLDTGGNWVLLASRTLASPLVPLATGVAHIHPNPFNPQTEITYRVHLAGPVEVAVFDLAGRCLAILASGNHGAGEHTVVWRGQDSCGRTLASGTYVVRLKAGSVLDSHKLLLVR